MLFAALWGAPFVFLVGAGLRLTSAAEASVIAPALMPVFTGVIGWAVLGDCSWTKIARLEDRGLSPWIRLSINTVKSRAPCPFRKNHPMVETSRVSSSPLAGAAGRRRLDRRDVLDARRAPFSGVAVQQCRIFRPVSHGQAEVGIPLGSRRRC
jgi:hypothetical protein